MKFRRGNRWRLHTKRPSVTVQAPSQGTGRRVARGIWSVPRISVNPDGTVTVRVSLVNHGDLDVGASIRLRHSDGWWFMPDNPQVTLKAQHGPVDVSSTFRLPPGRRVRASDDLTVQVDANGVPVADTTVGLGGSHIPLTQVAVLGWAAAVAVTGTTVAVDRASHEEAAPIPTTSTSAPVEPSTTTSGPAVLSPTTATTGVPTVPQPPTSTTSAPPRDVCPNVPGSQPNVPTGFVLDAGGRCVPQVQPCNASTQSGGAGTTVTLHELGEPGPVSFHFDYKTFDIPDEFIIRYEGKQVLRVPPVATNGDTATVNLPAGTSSRVEVTAIGPAGTTTAWEYTVGCPTRPSSTQPPTTRPGTTIGPRP